METLSTQPQPKKPLWDTILKIVATVITTVLTALGVNAMTK